MWRKHRVFRLLTGPLIGLILLTTFSSALSLLLTQRTASAADGDSPSPSTKAAAWSAGMALSNCSNDAGWISGRGISSSDINKGMVFQGAGNDTSPWRFIPGPGTVRSTIRNDFSGTKIVGYLTDPDDGKITCDNADEVKMLIAKLGYDSPLAFLKDANVYKLDSGGSLYKATSGDDSVLAKRIRDKVAEKFGFSYGKAMPNDMQYAALRASFNQKCKGGRDSGGKTVYLVDSSGNLTTDKWSLKEGLNWDSVVEVGYSIDGSNDQRMSCQAIIDQMKSKHETYMGSVTIAPDTDPNGSTGLSDNKPTCETSGNPMTWIMCPIFNGVANFTDWMFRNMVEPMLRVSPVGTDPSDDSFKIWSSFRLYGNIFLIIAMLVVVIGQSVGGGLIDAYTAKKIMPRILVAAILINLSIYIVALLVDITNIIGAGIGQLITAPLGDAAQFQFSPNGVQSIVIGGGTIFGFVGGLIFTVSFVGIGAAASFLALFVLLPAVVGVIGAFLTLVIRQGLILTLILVSPVAFALYCLPNTEKYFKKWWDLLVKALLVYPIVIVMFAIADVLAVTIQKANDFGSGPLLTQTPQNIMAGIIAFVAMFLPLVMIPWAFKMAGGLVGSIIGAIDGWGKKGTEAIKGNPNNINSLRNRVKRDAIENMTREQHRIIRGGEGTNATRRQRAGARFWKVAGGNVNARMSRLTKEAKEREEMESATGYDGYRYAANWFSFNEGEALPEGLTAGGAAIPEGSTLTANRGDQGQIYFDSKGRRISRYMALSSEARHGRSEHSSGSNLEYAVRKVQTDADIANARRAFAAKAVRENWNTDQIREAWARSYFEHKDKFSSEYFSTPSAIPDAQGRTAAVAWEDVADNPTNQNSQVNELHKTKVSFQLSSVRGVDYKSWDSRREQIQNQLDAGATISDEDAQFFAETNEILDSLVTTGQVQFNPDGEPQVMGGTAEARGILQALYKNRRYGTQASIEGAAPPTTPGGPQTPIYSMHRRDIVRLPRDARGVVIPSGPGAPPVQPVRTVEVTGEADRNIIPIVAN